MKDYQKFALDIAVRAKREECNTEVDYLKHGAKILRRNLINFKESITEHFQGSATHNKSNLPPILGIFLQQLNAGDRGLNDSRTKDVERDTCSIANSFIYCIRSDRQMTYNPCVIDSFYNESPTLQQIGICLTVHQATRNKQVINLLSDYKLSIPYHQVERLETAIGGCIIDKVNGNGGTYIPLNFSKGIIPMFHINNIEFSEDTADGRSTTHALNCVAFQPKQPNVENNIILDLPKHPKNKCLKTNSFGILKDCTKPSVKDFHHNKGFDIASTQRIPLSNFRTWVFAKAMEFLCSGYGKAFLVQLGRSELTDMHTPANDTEEETNDLIRCPPPSESTLLDVSVEDGSTEHGALKKLESLLSNSFDEMEIPSFGGMNSIVGKEVNESDLINVATMRLIPGPASSFTAIYTAMNRAQHINNWCRGVIGKTIISLDLDLYEKVYLLVNSRDDLRDRYILRLGELHIVFAMIRAIGTYIEGSGIDQSWVKSGWFGENTVKQVLTCSHIKRALDAHESTVIALYVLYLRSFFMENTDLLIDFENNLSIITKLRSENIEEVRMTFSVLQEFLNEPQIKDKLQCFDQKRQNNAEFKFLMTYMEMVKGFLTSFMLREVEIGRCI